MRETEKGELSENKKGGKEQEKIPAGELTEKRKIELYDPGEYRVPNLKD